MQMIQLKSNILSNPFQSSLENREYPSYNNGSQYEEVKTLGSLHNVESDMFFNIEYNNIDTNVDTNQEENIDEMETDIKSVISQCSSLN